LQELADAFADGRAPGFARQDAWNIASLKTRRESFGLCRLPTSFRSLKRDERQPRHLPIVKQSS
jgi:hypothetical protein